MEWGSLGIYQGQWQELQSLPPTEDLFIFHGVIPPPPRKSSLPPQPPPHRAVFSFRQTANSRTNIRGGIRAITLVFKQLFYDLNKNLRTVLKF